MHKEDIQHTLVIFEHMHRRMPPLVPDIIKNEFNHALEHLKSDFTITLDELEDTVIVFGKKIWPYWKAFEEILNMEEGRMAEKFFIGKLSPELKKKFKEFKEHGGSYRDLYSGDPMHYFSPEERGVFCKAFIEVDSEIRKHAKQMVLSTEKEGYQDLILDFQEIFDDIEKRLDTLRVMADSEQEHPQLADEIRDQIRTFEYGMCLLGDNIQHADVCRAEAHFKGRKQVKKLFR
jgi:hypothetical protein